MDGEGKKTTILFTKEELMAKNGKYSENQMSTAIVVKYGAFVIMREGIILVW